MKWIKSSLNVTRYYNRAGELRKRQDIDCKVMSYEFRAGHNNTGDVILMLNGIDYLRLSAGQSSAISQISGIRQNRLDCTKLQWRFVDTDAEMPVAPSATDYLQITADEIECFIDESEVIEALNKHNSKGKK